MTERVQDLDEAELLTRIFAVLGSASAASTLLGPGDDSAIVAAADGRFTISTDLLVEGHHFRRDWSSGYDIGWRAAMQNMADAAAMGARPTALTVGLVLPADTEVAFVQELARGFVDAGGPWALDVVGGDLVAGPCLMVAVTVTGDLGAAPAVLRSGARPGDVLALAGRCGWSAAGLAVLGSGRLDETVTRTHPQVRAVIEAFRRPVAAIAEGVAARPHAHAMMDVSDGLVRDAARIAAASGVSIELREPEIALARDAELLGAVAEFLGDPGLVRAWLLGGGEDHAMLAAFPADAVPAGFAPVGAVKARAGQAPAVTVAGAEPHVRGWDHFRR
ncbi:thiamine-phosphate kinase [Rarobacter incanus]|uniref:Thiamine-monophosphate kinase n=1 Tax=Rarobacter incanus TaxID=153494 RepID=A0A542SSK9_9MICO|nr:thiamine-phosphate kinase [Rarobacter incanus]TQK77257.1 thiamine-monophosphate kinase [Rarobacter incanus]